MSREVRVVRGPTLRGGIPTVTGVIPADTLVQHHVVPLWDPLKKTGYQRNLTTSRVTTLARMISAQGVDLPTSVLLNMRAVSFSEMMKTLAPDRYIFELDQDKKNDEHSLYVVDGQHRIAALHKAMVDYDSNIGNINIPFVCMIGASELQEMEQFYVVNKNSKPVPTNLAYDIMLSGDNAGLAFAEHILKKQGRWQVEAQLIVDKLFKESSVWKGRIRLANHPKGESTVPSSSFIKSLKREISEDAFFRRHDVEKKTQLLNAYWLAIGVIYPNAQAEPSKYTVHKGLGVNVFHNVLPIALSAAHYSHNSIFQRDTYVEILKEPLSNIDGTNSEGDNVMGEEFWRSGSQGAAGAFSSVAGQDMLSKRLASLIPLGHDDDDA